MASGLESFRLGHRFAWPLAPLALSTVGTWLG